MKQVVIVAGGKATRLATRLNGLPKCLIPIDGKPLIRHQLEWLSREGFRDILILGGHHCNRIWESIQDLPEKEFVTTCDEPSPLGTGGAIHKCLDLLADTFIVVYGDLYTNIWLRQMTKVHAVSGVEATVLVRLSDHAHDSTLVETKGGGHIIDILNPPHTKAFLPLSAMCGIYIINKQYFPKVLGAFDLTRDALPHMLSKGYKILAYIDPHVCKDIGTPERYDEVLKLVEEKKW